MKYASGLIGQTRLVYNIISYCYVSRVSQYQLPPVSFEKLRFWVSTGTGLGRVYMYVCKRVMYTQKSPSNLFCMDYLDEFLQKTFYRIIPNRLKNEAEWRIYASLNWVIIGSDNGLSPVRRQAIIWTNAVVLLIGPLGTNFSETLMGIQTFSFNKLHLKTSSAKWRLFVSASMS